MKTRGFRLSMALALVAFLAMGIASVGVSPAVAGTVTVDTEAYNVVCEVLDFGTYWVSEDGVHHLRNRVLRSVVISENEYHNGTGKIYANFNMDPAAGVMTYFGNLEIHPADFPDNYWAGSYTIQIVPSGADGIARLKGYGSDLAGWKIRSNLTPLTPAELAGFAYACDGNTPISGVHSEATILMPGGN
jgi:hypothetical protein